MGLDVSKPWTVDDLDAAARQALKEGALPKLSMELNVWCRHHPNSGVRVSRNYESDLMTLNCVECGCFVLTLKIAKE